MSNLNNLSAAIRIALFAGAATVFAAPAFAQTEEEGDATEMETMVVTGSRIKRADIEGALPVQVIDRESIDASGDISVAELLRDSTYASFGNFKPQSGSSAQSLADVDLRGLGSQRTLVLIDGRRVPKSPFVGTAADLNAIPLAAVERIEILSDGASAVYGSDAIGGVINVILRKDFEGAEIAYGQGNPRIKGGDLESGSAMIGAAGDRGRMLAGVSFSNRGMVFTRDQIGYSEGVSTFSNLYRIESTVTGGPTGAFRNMPGFACNEGGFYIIQATGSCSFNFNAVAANEAEIDNSALFARGDYQINDNWSTYMTASVTRTESFGRYAPGLAELYLPSDSPNDPLPGDGLGVFLRHRFAAAGNRDNNVDATNSDVSVGFLGRIADKFDIDLAARRTEYKGFELGNGYIVDSLAASAAAAGTYNLLDPFGNSQAVLDSIKATISRDTQWLGKEVYGTAAFDVFEMGGGTSSMVVGLEWRSEDYADLYDSLSAGGVISSSAGNSAFGGRNIRSAYAEWLFPITSNFDITAAGRFDKYSDYGSDFAPKVAFRFQPWETVTFRGSYGEGFVAPSLPELTQQPAFAADPVIDFDSCVSQGGNPATCASDEIQIDATVIANGALSSEESEQWTLGASWDALEWLNVTVDYYDTRITNTINAFTSQELIDRSNNPQLGPIPPGLSVVRDPQTNGIIRIIRGSANDGILDTDGLDVNIRTTFDFGGAGSLASHLNVASINNFEINGLGNQTGLIGLPNLRSALQNSWTLGDFTFTVNSNFIKGQQRTTATDPRNVGGYTTHDVQVQWNAPWNAKIALGATNVGDKYPALVQVGGRPWNFFLYDAYGRTPYLRYTQSF
jgi:iron complex outermembrane receptor protein